MPFSEPKLLVLNGYFYDGNLFWTDVKNSNGLCYHMNVDGHLNKKSDVFQLNLESRDFGRSHLKGENNAGE